VNKAVVYWIRHKDHSDPYNQGYVGVTTNFSRRTKSHIREVKQSKHSNEFLLENLTDEVVIDLLFEGLEEECYDLERKYRPFMYVGWNIAPGVLREDVGDRDILFRKNSKINVKN